MVYSVAMLNDLAKITVQKKMWKEAGAVFRSFVPVFYMVEEKTKLYHAVYSVISPEAMHRALWKPDDFPGKKEKDMYDFLTSTIPGEVKLKYESKRRLWNPIFNSPVELCPVVIMTKTWRSILLWKSFT